MGLGDLLNFDYGFDAGGAPLYDVDSSLYSDLMGAYTGGMPDLGVDFYDGAVPTFEINQLELAASPETADAIARAQAEVSAGGAPGAANLSTIYDNFGLPTSAASLGLGGASMRDALKSLPRAGGGSGGGGGGVNAFSMPRIESPVAASVAPPPTGAVPQTAPPSGELRFAPLPEPPDTRGLARLFAEALRGAR